MDPASCQVSSTIPLSQPLSAVLRELAYVRRNPIEGRKAIFAKLKRPHVPSSVLKIAGNDVLPNHGGNDHMNENSKVNDFEYYPDSDDEGIDLEGYQNSQERLSCNFVDCITSRELGLPRIGGSRFFNDRLSSEYGTRHMLCNNMLKENCNSVPNMDKVFCSSWLSHRQVVFGTKCNQLMVFDVNTRHMDQIPSLPSSENSSPLAVDSQSGIHAIAINPSRTLLATGGKQSNDLAIYRLPTLDPICVGEGAHSDWIFDLTWIDDQFVVSGSRDGTLAVWRISDRIINQVIKSEIPSFLYIPPDLVKKCKNADKVR